MVEDVAFAFFSTFYEHDKNSKVTAREYFDNLDKSLKRIWLTSAEKAVKIVKQ